MTDTIHRLTITLHDVKPTVWRRIEVPSSMTLGELSPVLEAAMGWLGGHLHLFDVDGVSYGTPDPEWETNDLDEGEFRLADVLPSAGWSMRWDYDFGDGWEHTVAVEGVAAAEPGVTYPRCIAGARACPPETAAAHGATPSYWKPWRTPTTPTMNGSGRGRRPVSTRLASTSRRPIGRCERPGPSRAGTEAHWKTTLPYSSTRPDVGI